MRPFALLAALAATVPAAAAEPVNKAVVLGQEQYVRPPKAIEEAVLAARGGTTTLANLSPNGKVFVVTKGDALPPLARMAAPCVHLAEMAFDPVACRQRDLWVRSADGFDLFYPAAKKTVPVQVPKDARVSTPVWSPDGSKLAYFALFPDATHIYFADGESGVSRRVTNTPVLATLAVGIQWTRDGKAIQTVLLPGDGKPAAPKPDAVAAEPKVRVARDGKDPSRTYRYLLESPYDMKLLEYLCTGQLAVIDINTGAVTKVGQPAMVRSVSMAPMGGQYRVTAVKKPFSYFAPFTAFGSLETVWDEKGATLLTLNDRGMRTGGDGAAPPVVAGATPPGAGRTRGGVPPKAPTAPAGATPPTDPATPPMPDPVPDPMDPTADPDSPLRRGPQAAADPDGKRDLGWRPDGNGMTYLQIEPAKKDEKDVRKDRVFQWLPPFGKDDAKVVYETPARITSALYSSDCRWLFLTQTIDGARQITAVDLNDDKKKTYVVSKPRAREEAPVPKKDNEGEQQPGRGGRGAGGFGGGSALLVKSLGGITVVRVSPKGEVYLNGTVRGEGANTFARPYIDRVAIATGTVERIFEAKGDAFEAIEAVDGDDVTKVYTTRQKTDVPPDSFVTDVATKESTKLTDNANRSPWFHKLKVERIRVTRADGFKFWVKVTTAPDAPAKLPALFWIYPREYADQAAYDAAAGRTPQATGRFTAPGPRSMAILTLAGYAVVEPDVPIVGPAGRMNDNYVPDLRNSLWAAIDELDKRGTIDRDRLACGGHSYGAFSTANAMVHTPFFKAGIAGDGNYNRTLTAMSFQTERRYLWDARETYLEMSPLLWANRMTGALLMYHGMEDANVGTNPMNSDALFMALDGLGKPAALYMYPYEGHGPLAQETTLDMWARWVAWLDTHLKPAEKK